MSKKLLVAVAVVTVVILALCVVIALQPSTFHVERSATIVAPPTTVFEQVNDLRKWEAWSPWVKLDPAMKQIYEGPASGVGASYTWAGNSNVGEGRMTIIESRPHEFVKIKLEFFKPFAGTNTAAFMFKPDGETTTLIWSMDGSNNFIAKGIGLFLSMDKMIGGNFEQGLAALKSIAEAAPK